MTETRELGRQEKYNILNPTTGTEFSHMDPSQIGKNAGSGIVEKHN